jgi:hypothetical protein
MRRQPNIPLAALWAGAALLLAAALWSTGFLYWQSRISRSIQQLREETRERLPADTELPSLLAPAGCRAIPPLLQEFRQAIERGDAVLGSVVYRELLDAKMAAIRNSDGLSFRASSLSTGAAYDLPYLKSILDYEEDLWGKLRHRYPPWWMWWSGSRRPKG